MPKTLERRVFPAQDLKILRADSSGLKFRGRPWVYGQESEEMWGFREIIEPGAATRTLANRPDVRFLVNHDANLLLARTTSGTLTLAEDSQGGIAEADMADVSYARDLAALMERGDLSQMSFGFWISADRWERDKHIITEFDLNGGDVSAVTFPAYPQTSAELRAAAREHLGQPGESDRDLIEALEVIRACRENPRPLQLSNLELLRDAQEALAVTLAALGTPDSVEQDVRAVERDAHRVRELELLASL